MWFPENQWNFKDAELFNHKARTAARNSNVLVENHLDWELTEAQHAEFRLAWDRLQDAFERGARHEAAADAATAQVSYDCWIEATEDGRADDAAMCRDAFEAAMKELEFWATYKLTDVNYDLTPVEVPAADPRNYLVYFDFDKSLDHQRRPRHAWMTPFAMRPPSRTPRSGWWLTPTGPVRSPTTKRFPSAAPTR